MNFTEAWNTKLMAASEAAQNNKKLNIKARINFEGGEASMVIPKYFKDEEFARDTLSRAWDTYCRGKNGLTDSINSIIIEESETFAFANHKKAGAKKSA